MASLRERTAAAIYRTAFNHFTAKGIERDRADKAARILERESFIGIKYVRSTEEQELITEIWRNLTH